MKNIGLISCYLRGNKLSDHLFKIELFTSAALLTESTIEDGMLILNLCK